MARAPETFDPGLHDALDGVPAPRETPVLFGHEEAESVLSTAYRSGRAHHGWLICGPRGIGKATLAFRFARYCLANPDTAGAPEHLEISPQSAIASKVAHGAHPNILHLTRPWDHRAKRFMTEITVDAVRQLIPFLGNTAGEGAWRFVIIDPADELNRNAANALLKALEEPPIRTFFLLIANRPGALPATVRSRCRRLELRALDEPALDAALAAISPDILSGPDGTVARALSGGSPRLAIEMARKDGVAIYRGISEIISRNSAKDIDAILSRAADTRGGGYQQFVNAYETYLHRRVRSLREPDGLPEPPELPLVTWAALWEKAARSAREVEVYNLDRKEFALELLEATMAAGRDPLPVS